MKPEHFKEFNLEHAKAGAPYGQKSDFPARIGIWDSKDRNGYALNGSVDSGDGSERHMQWTEKGICSTGFASSDLVMLPLGYCEGKPVFVGDELLGGMGRLVAEPMSREFRHCSWPRKEPVMPKHIEFSGQSIIHNEALATALIRQRPEIEAYWTKLDEFNGVWR